MTTLTSFFKTDLVDDHLANDINELIGSSLRPEYQNIETISTTRQLLDGDTPYQLITASGANRDIKLAAEAITNHPYVIINSGATYNVVVKDDSGSTTFVTLFPGEWCLALSNGGSAWKTLLPGRTFARVWSGKTTSPTTGDDSADGYALGDRWIDETNNKEYVALDVTVGAAVWTETTTSGGSGAVPHFPEGRLTLASAAPVMTAEQASKTSVYYSPYVGDLVPIYNGSTFVETTVAELTLALDSDSGHTNYHQSGKNFDCFVINDSGTIRLGTGPAWSSDTSRGTGAGTTELEVKNGIKTNKNTITIRFGSLSGNTVSVAANRATYVGYIRTSANGTTTWELGGQTANGDEARLYIYNAYNKVRVNVSVRDSTTSWTYNSTTVRAMHASNTNRVSFLSDDADDISAILSIMFNGGASGDACFGISLDVTNSYTQYMGYGSFGTLSAPGSATWSGKPGLGYHYLQCVESQITTTSSATYYGQVSSNQTMNFVASLMM